MVAFFAAIEATAPFVGLIRHIHYSYVVPIILRLSSIKPRSLAVNPAPLEQDPVTVHRPALQHRSGFCHKMRPACHNELYSYSGCPYSSASESCSLDNGNPLAPVSLSAFACRSVLVSVLHVRYQVLIVLFKASIEAVLFHQA